MSNKIEVVQGDITQQKVDALVNATHNSLIGGKSVDGVIKQKTVAFSSINTGAYRFPLEQTIEITVIETINFFKEI